MKRWVLDIVLGFVLMLMQACPVVAQPRTNAARLRDLEQRVNALVELQQDLPSIIREGQRQSGARFAELEAKFERMHREQSAATRALDLTPLDARMTRLEAVLERLEGEQRLQSKLPASTAQNSPVRYEQPGPWTRPARAVLTAVDSVSVRATAPSWPSRTPTVASGRLTGRWRLSSGDEFDLTDDGNQVRMRLVHGGMAVRSSATLSAAGDGTFRGTIAGTFRGDPREQTRFAPLVIRSRGLDAVEIETDYIGLDRWGNEIVRSPMQTTMLRVN